MFFIALILIYVFWTFKCVRASKCCDSWYAYLPFIGTALAFAKDPILFLLRAQKVYGDEFVLNILGIKLRYLLGPKGNKKFFNLQPKQASAAKAYLSLTRPVFGPRVAYDADPDVFLQQKRFAKNGVSKENLMEYVPLIEMEANLMLDSFNEVVELCSAMAELTTRTATLCLMGEEVRQNVESLVSPLLYDLDKGFQPLNFLFEHLPLKAYRERDKAHKKLKNLFLNLINVKTTDSVMDLHHFCQKHNKNVLNTLISSTYKDGTKLPSSEAASMMIALLVAGQHTSSTTVTWMISLLTLEMRQKILLEMSELSFENIQKMKYLDACLKETLRLHPPIFTVIRKTSFGNYVCASPAVSHLDESVFPNPFEFIPERWIPDADVKYSYLPFGDGRHRCVGEPFAYIQIKTIVCVLLQRFPNYQIVDEKMKPNVPKADYTTMIVMPKRPVFMINK